MVLTKMQNDLKQPEPTTTYYNEQETTWNNLHVSKFLFATNKESGIVQFL